MNAASWTHARAERAPGRAPCAVELGVPVLPARFTSPSRLVGRLLCVRWVFLRWRVCRAVIAGSCLRAVENHGAGKASGLGQAPGTAPALWDPARKMGSYRSCACRRGLLLRMRVWRWTRRLICGGRLSSLLLLRSR